MLDVSGGFKAKKTKILIIAGIALLVVFAGAALYFYQQYQGLKTDQTVKNEATVSRVVDEVAKMLQVPADEEPQVARITDPEKVKSQSFYNDSQKDDYLIVYQKAQIAIIYRESSHKLINVDHVQIGQDNSADAASGTKK